MPLMRVVAWIAGSVALVGLAATFWLTAPSDPVSSPLARIWQPDPPAPTRSEGGPAIHWGGRR